MVKMTQEEELFLYQMYRENQEKEFNEWVARMEQEYEKMQEERLREDMENADIIFMNILEQRGL